LLWAPNGFQRAVLDCTMRQWDLPIVPTSFYHNADRMRKKAEQCRYYQAGVAGTRVDIGAGAGAG
jgi:hypothetical protein